MQKEFDRKLLTQYVPATVFIGEDGEILHTRGNVNRYLKLAPGRASLNLLKMVLDGLQFDLRSAIARARKDNRAVKKQSVLIESGSGNDHGTESERFVNFEVVPVSTGQLKDSYFMVVFEDSQSEVRRRKSSGKRDRESESWNRQANKLAQELAATKEHLQAVIETHEATNEELQSANEEILSSNEELQSTNEELETAREELQSTNEELTTVNDELRSRNTEVSLINNDLMNLLSSIDIAVVMVGSDLTIRRFTQRAQELFALIPGDVGRPLGNINPAVQLPGLEQIVMQVMEKLQPVEKTLTDPNGNRFQLRVLPYRTAENKVDGAVITLVDVSRQAQGAKT
jgi:two-component system CheB/CheR fusion protein